MNRHPDELPMSPFGAYLGIATDYCGEGTARCSVQLKDHHYNTGGRVHGGVLTALADTAAGLAVRSVRPDGQLSATTDLVISFLRPPGGDSLHAEARVIQAGRRLIRTEISVTCDDKLVARSSATFMLFQAT